MREAAHGCDSLLGDVVLSGGVLLILTRTNAVDLLVDLRSVVVTVCMQLVRKKVVRKTKIYPL